MHSHVGHVDKEENFHKIQAWIIPRSSALGWAAELIFTFW